MSEEKKFNPWPWGLAGTLLAFCLIQFSLVTLASRQFQGLDDVEYYRHGVEYGKEMERQERQQDLGWTMSENLNQATSPNDRFPFRLALLDADQKPIMHAKARVRIGRPASLREDISYPLKEVGPGIYASDVSLGAGNWKFDIEVEKGENLVKAEFRHRVSQPPVESVRTGST